MHPKNENETYTIIHVPQLVKSCTYTADTLSRAPMVEVKDEDDLTDKVHAFVNVVMQGVPAAETRLEEIKRHQLEDEICREITKYVREGWPEKERLKGIVQQY